MRGTRAVTLCICRRDIWSRVWGTAHAHDDSPAVNQEKTVSDVSASQQRSSLYSHTFPHPSTPAGGTPHYTRFLLCRHGSLSPTPKPRTPTPSELDNLIYTTTPSHTPPHLQVILPTGHTVSCVGSILATPKPFEPTLPHTLHTCRWNSPLDTLPVVLAWGSLSPAPKPCNPTPSHTPANLQVVLPTGHAVSGVGDLLVLLTEHDHTGICGHHSILAA